MRAPSGKYFRLFAGFAQRLMLLEQVNGQLLGEGLGVSGLVFRIGLLTLVERIGVVGLQFRAAVLNDALRHLHRLGVGVLSLVQHGYRLGQREIALGRVDIVDRQAVRLVLLPLSVPILAVVFILSFIAAITEVPVASLLLRDVNSYTLAVGMQQYLNPQNYLWGDFAAAAVMSALPITIVFLLAQRWLVNGLTAGGVKG